MARFGDKQHFLELDFAAYPVVVLTAVGSEFTDAQVLAVCETYTRELSARTGMFATVQDLRDSGGLGPRQRRILVDAMQRNADINQRCAGHAMVFGSPLMRGMMTAILWLRRPAYSLCVFADPNDAAAWAREQIRLRSVVTTTRVR